jgi:hypothetical protein
MKKMLSIIILLSCLQTSFAQWDPFVTGVDISPAPMQPGQPSTLSFVTGNLGFLPLNNLAQPMRISVSLANGIPHHIDEPLSSVTGHEDFFNVEYIIEANTLFFTQKAIIPTPLEGGVTQINIAYHATDSTPQSNPFNGMQINVIPPAYTVGHGNDIENDQANIFTWTLSVILPIQLRSFDAVMMDCKVYLSWVTESELNNSFFTLYKSLNAQDWNAIARIEGAGNNNTVLHYDFWDDDVPDRGIIYYQLSQTDFDGSKEFFKILSVQSSGCFHQTLRVYPSPADAKIIISLNQDDEYWLSIYNAAGKLVFSNRLQHELSEVDVSRFAAGTYFVKINGSLRQFTEQIVIQR